MRKPSLLRITVAVLCALFTLQSMAMPAKSKNWHLDPTQAKKELTAAGKGSKVKLYRQDQTRVVGRIQFIGDDSVTLKSKHHKAISTVAYSNLNHVEEETPTGLKIGIGAMYLVAIPLIPVALLLHSVLGGCP